MPLVRPFPEVRSVMTIVGEKVVYEAKPSRPAPGLQT
jgi:hypothetical protein